MQAPSASRGASGFIGLGHMGAAMAHRLLQAGFPLVVHDLSPAACAPLAAAGAQVAGSAREVADAAEVVFLCLPSAAASRSVVEGPHGLLAGRALRVVVETSTVGPAALRSLAALLAARGVALVDAPVSGGPRGAQAGTLSVMHAGACLLGDFDMCTITCTQDVANDCGDQGVTGLCVPVENNAFVCAGDLTFGADKDDEILKPGDSLKRTFQSVTDADLFLIDTPGAGTYQVAAFPAADDTLKIDFYNGDGTKLGTVMSAAIGEPAGGDVDTQGGVFFAVVTNTGNSNGDYNVQVVKQ